MTLRDKLLIYVCRKSNEIEAEEKELKNFLFYSALDNLDHYEILLHRIRLQSWNEFVKDLTNILLYCENNAKIDTDTKRGNKNV